METIVPGVHQISSQAVNSFIIDGDEGVTLIDTGMPRRHGKIVAALGEIGRSIDDVRAIVLTHSHADHAGGAAALKKECGAPVFASDRDAPAIRGAERPPPPPLADRIPFLGRLMALLPPPAPVVVEHVVGEAIAGALPADLRAVDTPGHTPGHTSYLLDRFGGVLFVGDAGMANRRGEVRRGWMNRPDPTIDASLRHLSEFTFDVACFGHSGALHSGASEKFAAFTETLQ